MKREKKKPSILTISLSLIFISVLSITLYNCVGSKVYKKVDEVSAVQNMPSLTRIDSETLPDSIRISIEASDKLDDMIQYTAFKMEAPLRLVLDIPGIDGSRFQEPIDVAKGAVNVIKPLYFVDSNITRIEIGLNQIVPYKILRPEGNILFIDIKNPPSITEEAIVEGSARPSPPPSSITDVEEKEGVEEEEGEPPVEAVSEEIKEQGVEEGLEEKEEGIPTVVKVTDVKSKEKEEKKIYIGKPISLDFQNANITNILRLITEVSGYNIITNESVKGKMTLRLNNVPWDQALDIILKNNKLGMEMEGNIIRILPISELLKEQQEKAEAKQAEIDAKKTKERAEPLITEVVRISYADISEMQTNLTSLKSERGSITIDARTNTLILKDIKLNLEEMKNLIKTLDKRTPQVTIEARVVEINKNYTRELGVQWGGKYNTKSDYHQNYTNMRGALIPPAETAGGIQPIQVGNGNYVVDLPSAIARGAGGGLGLTLGNLGNTNVLDIQLSAMESSGKGRILSNPKITTLNNKEAVIESGRRIPYQSVSASGTQTQFVNASISLTVTPHITPDNYVSLNIEVTKDEADFANQSGGMPTIMQKKATTEVLVKDSDTTVIGGLYTSKTSKEMSGVPWFNKIPILGWFFKREKVGMDEDSELLVFITPMIVKGEEM